MGDVAEQVSAAAGRPAGAGKWITQLVGVAISVACLFFIFRQVELAQLRDALAALHWGYVVAGVASLACGYFLRVARWAVMLRAAGAKVSTADCAAPFLGSITLNNVLPFRAGDFVRALVFPNALGVARTTASASLLLERLVDLLTLLLSLGIGLSLGPLDALPDWLGRGVLTLALLGSGALVGVIVLGGWVRALLARLQTRVAPKPAQALGVIAELVAAVQAMARPRTLLALFGLSMLIWLGEAGLFWALLTGLGMQATLAIALMIMAMATLSTLVPSSPGYVGPFHLAAYTAVTMLHGAPAQAATFAVLAHLGLWLPTTLAGGIAILSKPGLFRLARQPQ